MALLYKTAAPDVKDALCIPSTPEPPCRQQPLLKSVMRLQKKSSLRVGSGLGGFGTSVPMAPGSSISRLVVIVVGGVFLLGGRTRGTRGG